MVFAVKRVPKLPPTAIESTESGPDLNSAAHRGMIEERSDNWRARNGANDRAHDFFRRHHARHITQRDYGASK
jgi:hypothetical protein